jgi:hypothetical protein
MNLNIKLKSKPIVPPSSFLRTQNGIERFSTMLDEFFNFVHNFYVLFLSIKIRKKLSKELKAKFKRVLLSYQINTVHKINIINIMNFH